MEKAPTLSARRYCSLGPAPARPSLQHLNPDRAAAVIVGETKWVNGTTLRYYFFDRADDGEEVLLEDGSRRFVSWVGDEAQRAVVRRAFRAWTDLGIGLRFAEVDDRAEAEIRIGISVGEGGAWSRVGRDVLNVGANERTMHFGWNLDVVGHNGLDTAVHEIGHTIGLKHEHQNPFSGIVWNEPAVLAELGGPPNSWDDDTIRRNVLDKLSAAEVNGSTWDPDSVMEYPFGPGLIAEPEKYRDGLEPAGGLSAFDRQYVLGWYPPVSDVLPDLEPFHSASAALPRGGQVDFRIRPPSSRSYQIATFGESDTVLVLFEDVGGELHFVRGDDDGGEDRNAALRYTLLEGRTYVLRVRCYYAGGPGTTGVMYW